MQTLGKAIDSNLLTPRIARRVIEVLYWFSTLYGLDPLSKKLLDGVLCCKLCIVL